MNKVDFLSCIKKVLKERDWPVSELARKINIPRGTLSNWLNNSSIPSKIKMEIVLERMNSLPPMGDLLTAPILPSSGEKEEKNGKADNNAVLETLVEMIFPDLIRMLNPILKQLVGPEDPTLRKKFRQIPGWKDFTAYVRALMVEQMRDVVKKENPKLFSDKGE